MRRLSTRLSYLGWPLLLLALGGWDLFRAPNQHVEKGNQAFKDGKYDEAADQYRAAQDELPGEPGVHFDLGAALYQKAMNTVPGADRDALLGQAEQ